jgi:hypothetical protein
MGKMEYMSTILESIGKKEIELGERAEPNGEGDGRGWKAEHS